MSKVPPSISSGVFAVTGSTVIDAPIETVWNTLLDLDGYKEWNPFVRGQTITDRSGKATGERQVTDGSYMVIAPIHLPPSMSDVPFYQRLSVFVQCTYIDSANYRVAWRTVGLMPKWLLDAERWQSLTMCDDSKVKYESVEVFKGVLAYVVKLMVGKSLVLGVDSMAQGLKKKAEGTTA